jgi:hypothetical protein
MENNITLLKADNHTSIKWGGNEHYNLKINIDDLIAMGFENSSFHHDLCPSYECQLDDDRIAKLYICDTEDPQSKEENNNIRFTLEIINEREDTTDIFETNSLFELQQIITDHLPRLYIGGNNNAI